MFVGHRHGVGFSGALALLESIYELEVDVEITAASTVPSGAIVGYAATSDYALKKSGQIVNI